MPPSQQPIAIVEDDASLRSALSRLLRSAGYPTRCFGSVEEFLETGVESPPACLVADVRLPGRNGLELPGLMAARGQAIPVILLTAYDDREIRSAAKRVGAAGYFRKPVDDQALLDTIEWTLTRGGPGAEEEIRS